MADVLLFTLEFALSIFLPWLIVRVDYGLLDPERLARSWNDASFWASIVVFGPLCLPFHFTKTRRNLFGLLIGILWMLATLAAIVLVAHVSSLLVGLVAEL